jgi:nitrous oxidase accessory protein
MAAAGAAALAALTASLPLWSMTMKAPQYPKGLRLVAYGTGMQGDLSEINIINHYIGMPPIDPKPAIETMLFPIGITALVLLCLASPLHRWIRRAAVCILLATPVGILVDLQWRLYVFGHSLDPKAPIRLPAFTPLILGESKLGNFVTSSTISTGVWSLIAAALLLLIGERLVRRRQSRAFPRRVAMGTAATAATALLFLAQTAGTSARSADDLQGRIDAAPRGGTVIVDGGVHKGPIVVHGPLTLVGRHQPVIDGGGIGSVVTIDGDDVTLRGFVVRNSGRQVTEEAAGITATGNRHRIEQNVVEDVYFGIHVAGGEGHVVRDNRIAPGERHGARPGHGISLWYTRSTDVRGNHVTHARDGLYFSFTEGVIAAGNDISGCRYGMHSMNSQNVTMERNTLAANLLGAALMQSDRLTLRGNRIERHREGSAAYGILLKDIGEVLAEDNTILANRIGLYAEGVANGPSRQALVLRNLIAGNDVGLALQSTAAMTVSGNRIADNLTDVRALGRKLSSGFSWSRDGRGNSWSQYRGFDADGDGIGDVPFMLDGTVEGLIQRNPLLQTFLYTPAHSALDAAVRMFPMFREPPIVVDPHPLMGPRPAEGTAHD